MLEDELEQSFLDEHKESLSNEQEERLADLKTKLTNHMRLSSLEVLCARKIADLRPMYAKQGLTQLSSVLPTSLCSLVYQEFVKPYNDNKLYLLEEESEKFHYDLIVENVLLFAEDGLEEFDSSILGFDRTMTYSQQLFEKLAKGSTNLKSLKDNRQCDYGKFENKLLLSEFYGLQNISSLVVLEINFFPARDADLRVIALCLPLLQRLHLFAASDVPGSISISIEGLKKLTNLKALKHLTFEVGYNSRAEGIQLVKNCLLIMPKVNTVTWTRALYDELFLEHDFPFYKGPVELGLEHLVLGEGTVIPSNVTLPNVTRITVLQKLTISLKQFKKLNYLSWDDSNDWSLLKQALSEVGHLLKRLDLAYHSLDIVQVLQLCPNLEELNLLQVEFDNFDASQLQNHVHNLKIFKHKCNQTIPSDLYEFPGLLHLLFTCCPKLEELEFDEIVLTQEEIKLITKDMEAGALAIEKLEKVKICASVGEDEDAYVSYAELACKVCVQNYKILKSARFEDYAYENKYFPEMELAQQMQHHINFSALLRTD